VLKLSPVLQTYKSVAITSVKNTNTKTFLRKIQIDYNSGKKGIY